MTTADEHEAEPEAPRPPRDPRRTDVVLWGLAMFAGCRALQLFLEAQATAASVAQAILVEWGSSRLGVLWSAEGTEVTAAKVARRAGEGLVVGGVLAAVVALVLAASHGATFTGVAHVEVSVLALGGLAAALTAWRDELLLHGVILRALHGSSVVATGRVLACAATSAGAALGRSDATPRSVVVAALLGVVAGALWVRDRGAWQPWAASTAFQFTMGTLLAGGVLSTRVMEGSWGGGDAGIAGGTAAVVALAPLAVLALVWTARTNSPQ
jgi:hypothetical protein